MQNFNITPTQTFNAHTITFVHADGTTDTGFNPPVSFSVDKPALASVENISGPCQVQPILPAAASGGIVTVTGKFTNENGVQVTQQFTVTITANPNPATGFLLS